MIRTASLFPTEMSLLTLNVFIIKGYKLFSTGNMGNWRNSSFNVDQVSDRLPSRPPVQEQQQIFFSIYNGTVAAAEQNEKLSDYYPTIFFCSKQRFKWFVRVKHKRVFIQSFFCGRKSPTSSLTCKSLVMICRINIGIQVLIPYSCEWTNFDTQCGDWIQRPCGGEDVAETAWRAW